MQEEDELVHAKQIHTLTVVGRGRGAKTVYLKVPKDTNAGLGFAPGDNVQVAIMKIVHKGHDAE